MTKRSARSIKWKIFIYLLAFVAGTVAVLWIFETTLLNSFYKFIKTRELNEAAQNIERSAAGITDGNIEEFEQRLLYEAERLNAQILLLDADGSLIYFAGYGTGERREAPAELGEDLEIAGAGEDDRLLKRDRQPGRSSRAPMDVITQTAQIQISDIPCTIIIEAMVEPVSAAVTTLKLILVIITAMLITAAFVLSRILYKKLATPIIETTQSALKLAEGSRDADFDARGYSEIESLNDTLNYAQEEIIKSDRLQKEIIANVSHDLRTPLTLIGGYAEMIRDFPKEQTAENAQVIIDESARLTKLVNDMLSLSKLNSGTSNPVMSEFSLTHLIKTIVRRYAELSKKEGLKIVFEPKENIICTADEGAISQVIYNLLTNADIYGGDEKLITVTQELNGSGAVISFIDSGKGIKEEDIDGIWKRYKTGTGERARGTGLGLNIVSSILDLHGAKYGVSSLPGKGSRFWFEIDGVRIKD